MAWESRALIEVKELSDKEVKQMDKSKMFIEELDDETEFDRQEEAWLNSF